MYTALVKVQFCTVFAKGPVVAHTTLTDRHRTFDAWIVFRLLPAGMILSEGVTDKKAQTAQTNVN